MVGAIINGDQSLVHVAFSIVLMALLLGLKVIAAVYGPKAGTKKNENPEKACIEIIWKPKTGQSGKPEREYEMVLKKTLQSICLLNVHPNTTTSIVIQVVNDDGALLPCAINAACAALVDAGIPLKHLAVAICCCMAESGHILLDPSKIEEQKVKAFIYLVFPNSIVSVLPQDVKEHGIITSVTHGAMAVDDYFRCLKLGRAAAAEMSDFLRNSIKLKAGNDPSRAG
ncbi:exosome complex exonuclease RRP46 [Tanacetum coccineum]